jgi:hypothetical protein
MDAVFKSIYARACMGAGLSVLTGIRAFLPIAFLALYSRLEFASAPTLEGTPFEFLERTWLLAVLFALAVIELALDKMPALSRTFGAVMRPLKVLLGGVVFASVMAPDGWIAMTVCGLFGLVIAGLAEQVRRSLRPDPSADLGPVLLMSIYEDVVVLVGTLVFVLVPLIGALLTCFLVLLVYRVRKIRARKHRGLRILKG